MLLEVARPVRREATRTTVGAQLQRAFNVAEYYPKPRKGRDCVEDPRNGWA